MKSDINIIAIGASPVIKNLFLENVIIMSGRGGTGRHAGFRCLCRKAWGFKSLRPHHSRLTARL